MPAKVRVKILAGRNLPVMDRSSDTTDAYVEVKLGSITHKTDVFRKSLNPQWNSDWYRFEVDDSELQDEPLQIRIMDHDTYSANDAIGKIYINLNPLLLPDEEHLNDHQINSYSIKGKSMTGWVPVFDTIHGIRGEVHLIVKVDLFTDVNKFRQSSCGVQFFYTPSIPYGYQVQVIHGFVEELMVDDDPEHHWIDKIRSPRASNEARQLIFFKMAGQVQRRVGLKAIDLGANAVIGYNQCFDLEGDIGIVARGIGTAVTLIKIPGNQQSQHEQILAEDRIRKYLEFLSCGSNKALNLEHFSKFDIPTDHLNYDPTDIVCKILGIDEAQLKASQRSGVISRRNSTDADLEDIQLMFEKEHLNEKLKKRQKKFTLSAKNPIRGRLSKGLKHSHSVDDRSPSISTSNSLSDVSFKGSMSSLKSSISDFGGFWNRKKNRQKVEGKTMATLLVRSVMLNPNLERISESNDTQRDSSTEPDKIYPLSISPCGSVEKARMKMKYPSNLSITSSSLFSTTDDEEGDDVEVDDDDDSQSIEPSKGIVLYDADTVSMIVRSVMAQEENEVNTWNEPTSIMHSSSERKAKFVKQYLDSDWEMAEVFSEKTKPKVQRQLSIDGETGCKLVRTGSTRVVSSSKKGDVVESEIIEHSPNPEEKKKIFSLDSESDDSDAENWITPGSTVDEPEIVEEKHSSAFHDFKDNLTEKFHSLMPSKSASQLCPPTQVGLPRRRSLKDTLRYSFTAKPKTSTQSINQSTPKTKPKNKILHPTTIIVSSEEEDPSSGEASLKVPTTYSSDQLNTIGNTSLLNLPQSSMLPKLENSFIAKHNSSDMLKLNANEKQLEKIDNLSRKKSHLDTNKAPSLVPAPNPNFRGDGLSTSPKAGNLAIDNKAQLTTSKSPSRGHQIPGAPRDHSGRRSSDSDISVTPLGNSLGTSDRPTAGVLRGFGVTSLKNPINQENIDMLEYPFLTMSIFPHGFIEHIGGAVAARSVKLLERVANPEEPESRDAWWNELRMEIRSHCRTLGCNFVLGYSEATSISDDVCVLSATGTAAVINVKFAAGEITTGELAASKEHGVLAHRDDKDKDLKDIPESTVKGDCSLCHLPFSTKSMPYEMKPYMCAVCHKSPVSDLLISTIELPDNVPISGLGTLIHAQVCRPKNSVRSESNAKEISDGIPFLEYDLYRLLINKVRSKGMNAIFGFKTFLSVGEKMIVLAASGTGVYLSALPQPDIPKIAPGNTWTDLAKLNDLQKSLQEAVDRNKEYYQLKPYFDETASSEGIQEGQNAEEDLVEMDLNHGSKNTCILEVDDIEDLDIISLLLEPCPPEGFYITTTQNIPGLNGYEISHNLQYFSQVWRVKNQTTSQGRNFPKHLVRLLQTIFFKLRAMTPCAICNLRLRVAVPNTEEIEFVVSGMTLSLEEIPRAKHQPRELSASDTKKNNDEDLMFKMDEETANDQEQGAVGGVGALTHTRSLRLNSKSPIRAKFSSMRISKQIPLKERFGVDITPLNYIPSGRIDKYLGNLNFFLIRETSSLRDAGGLSGFTHGFIMELLAIVRAHVAALGGNAMTSFSISEFSLADNPHKGQGQCLVSVTGDVVFVSYSGSE